jgi:hypothetical protein
MPVVFLLDPFRFGAPIILSAYVLYYARCWAASCRGLL